MVRVNNENLQRKGRDPVQAAPAIQVPSSLEQLPPVVPLATANLDDNPVAIIVAHGMGQQVPYETLASLADKLSNSNQQQDQTVRHVHFVDAVRPKRSIFLPRAELTVPEPGNPNPNARRRKVHIYEVYWAPLTESGISLTEVVRFLGVAGGHGLVLGRHFLHWLFGKDRRFLIPWSTPVGLLGALLLILALVAINGVLTLVVGGSLVQADVLTDLFSPMVSRLSQDLWLLLLLGAVAWGALTLSNATRKTPSVLRSIATGSAWVFVVLVCVGLMAVALLMVYHYWSLRGKTDNVPNVIGVWSYATWPWWQVGLVWGTALAVSWRLRGFFVQYLGDVAIYIDADKVDKYHTMRQQIRELANRTACAIYAARRSNAPEGTEAPFLYERVIVVGHSLGSVIAYDLLNAALVLDESLGQRLHVQERTRALITFGSPLDKTAYIFHSKQPKNSLRAALRASAQPLTRSIPAREAIRWANIYSAADFISGRLQFYDYPYRDPNQPTPWLICNMRDPDACTPATAHNQYWENRLLTTTIAQAVFASSTHIGWPCMPDTRPTM